CQSEDASRSHLHTASSEPGLMMRLEPGSCPDRPGRPGHCAALAHRIETTRPILGNEKAVSGAAPLANHLYAKKPPVLPRRNGGFSAFCLGLVPIWGQGTGHPAVSMATSGRVLNRYRGVRIPPNEPDGARC